jgi:hypothetical protein
MAFGIINAEQLTTQSGFTLGAGNASSFKNRIINGAMVIDQRNAGASVTLTSGGVYTVDRWQGFEDTDGTMTAQQSSTVPTGFTNSLVCTTTSADASLGATQFALIQQKIEGFNFADLGWGTANAQTATLSFWVRSSLTGTFGGALSDTGANNSYPFTYTISSANTWEQKTVTISGPTSGTFNTTNGVGVHLRFGLGVGSTYSGTAGAWSANSYFSATGATSVVGTNGATFYITGVQLEVGTVATSFDYRPYGTELALCYRYYRRYASSGGAYTAWGPVGVTAGSTSFSRLGFPLDIPMRTAPTVGFSSCIGWNGVIGGAVTVGNTYSSINNVDVDVNTSGITSTVGLAAKVLMSGSSAYVELTGAEL